MEAFVLDYDKADGNISDHSREKHEDVNDGDWNNLLFRQLKKQEKIRFHLLLSYLHTFSKFTEKCVFKYFAIQN